ncbi:alpha/beta fold hydrolase [Streptomyces clavuligerus]|nr:alpha/beta hydrolase [Streptomyces clavuligerus]ANW22224.1 carboxylesterase [Streptomyces clavuligerus]AXU17118.1 alpha/beta fold hydrolase [Streptomyces clavuligerus]EDY47720.1 carboxylesterase [Streptomyces clavuligerus]MBY6307237.1 alpha/beta fold hydrolase [Streptomyces clavuligerus]QCS10188.1 alpha/beta hydrolase [Streptomyces clavuligerus]
MPNDMADGSDPTARFLARYDAVLRKWPVPVRAVEVPSRYGTTRVHVCGPADGTPLVLLPGGGDTSAVWHVNAGELAREHRVYAVDLMGDFGRSTHSGAPLRGTADLLDWLDTLMDALGLDRARLCGHSYGAWIALNYALRSPDRVGGLALLDPINCFTRASTRYLLRALPLLLRPSPERILAFQRWETGLPVTDPVWRAFLEGTAWARRSKVLPMRRPGAEALRACAVPCLVVLAGESKAHDARRTGAAVPALMPRAEVVVLPDVSHHSLPLAPSAGRLLVEFWRSR